MPARHAVIRHRIGGGWAPDFGPTAQVELSELIRIPWLVNGKNIIYTLDGGTRKIGGTAKLNSSVLESGAKVVGLYDYWRQGIGGAPTQKRVIHVGTKIKKDDADGTFADIVTGMEADAVPSYATFDDDLIIMSDSTTDVPRLWDQSAVSIFGTNTPNCAFGCEHNNRFWMAGDAANPSRLYYSQALPNGVNGDWDDSPGSGTFDIGPGDGDAITAIVSHKKDLWIFKGPYKGSIHRLTGSSVENWALHGFVKEGLGAASQNGIFRYSDDVGFLSHLGTVHSLKATAAFGDFHEAALSLPLNQWLKDHVRKDRLKYAWADNLTTMGIVVITLSTDTNTTNNFMLEMDYRFQSTEGVPRWAYVEDFDAACVANVVDGSANDQNELYIGCNDGFVRKMNRANRSLDGSTGYAAKVTFPFLNYGAPVQMKTLESMSVGISPRGNYNMTVGWTRDDNAQQTTTVAQGGGDVLAPADANQFTLGDIGPPITGSRLGGAQFVDRFMDIEEGGEFRSIQYEFSNGGTNEDMEVHTLSAAISGGARSLEN